MSLARVDGLGPLTALTSISLRHGLRGLCGIAAAFAVTAAAPAETLELSRTGSGHVTIDVEIAELGPFTFVIDTGANRTAIAQPIAEQLGFQSRWDDYGDVQSLTRVFEAERFVLDNLRHDQLDPMTLNAVVIPMVSDDPIEIAGLLGADAIGSDRYTIDFAAGRLVLDAAAPTHADGVFDGRRLPLGTARLRGGLTGVRVMIDSGSRQTLVNNRLARQILHRGHSTTFSIHGVDSVVGEIAVAVRLRNLEVGGICVNSMTVLQSELEIFDALGWANVPAMVIGMDILQHSQLTIDREAGVFELSAAADDVRCRGADARGLADSATMP